jgi:cytochrome c oxidase subunit 2
MFGLAAGAGIPVLAWAEPEVIGRPAEHQLNMQPAVTGIGDYIYSLHNWMMIVCLIIFFAVFGVMFYSVFKHRKSLGHKAATFHESTAVEIAWTVVPFLIVIGMAGISFLSNLSTPRSAVGEPGVAPTTPRTETYLLEVDNEVVVPVNKKVRLVLTANDVIHSWTVPAFAVKQDAIPGFVRDSWFKAEKVGTYRGNCVELCGKEHAFMPIVVKVVSAADYTAWVNTKKKEMAALADDPNKVWTIDELKTKGEKVYASNCVVCHQASGQGSPGNFAALVGSPVVLGPKAEQINVLLNGKHSGKFPTAMPAWKQLSDTDIASVITYTRNNWTNKAEQNIVQPSEVLAARGK